jgi:hypothetical protein
MDGPGREQQEWLEVLDRIGGSGHQPYDMFATDRCLNRAECSHLVAEPGTCPVPSCRCTRHESPARPVLTEGDTP